MPAVVKIGPGPDGVIVTEVAVPEVLPGLAAVRVTATGLCGTDVHVAHDEYGYEAPVVMGHEITGTVIEVGGEADADWLGRPVACETYFSTCETCRWCRAGRRNLCPQRRSLGSYEHGGFAEIVVLPVLNLHELPQWLDPLEGVLAEPLACVTQCLLDPPVVQAGDRVLVTGPGAMGQLAAQVAGALGAAVTVSGLDRDARRLEVAGRFGATTTTSPLIDGSFDVVLECSGSEAAAEVALAAVARGGRYVQIGIFGRPVTVPIDQILFKELTVTSGFASTATSWRRALRMIEAKQVTLGPLVTGQVPLEDVHAALEAVERGDGLKTVVVPGRHDGLVSTSA
ncbi:Zn-dependent alcohol dehydrogenase [Brachybacterium vulturis]|uniref:Zn-dependent alcohol dehydrogenase n=2 Tax=Brachybacterium vulturis TaxID=2017484 RepID=A0A291GSP6_9MICO|nr:Zn-dependent alcohol dehydrogenase [Brachybacterium vulturis]